MKDELVVLLHGLGASAILMRPLERRLAERGYRVVNWAYPSLRHTIERHGRKLHEELERLLADASIDRLHLVAHSMGSIVARYALSLGRPGKLGRVVMLAPPSTGARMATLFGPALRWCVGTIDQLAARPDSFVNRLPPLEGVEVGVIAAGVDLLVGRHHTHLAGQRDHITLAGSHSFMIFQRRVAEQVVHFLAHGRFASATPAGADA